MQHVARKCLIGETLQELMAGIEAQFARAMRATSGRIQLVVRLRAFTGRATR